jgi:hypothetical protein
MASTAAPHTGTTIVACTFDGGVVLGADGRVSTGRYISNRASNKIAEITDNTFLLRSGSAADCEAIASYGTRSLLDQALLCTRTSVCNCQKNPQSVFGVQVHNVSPDKRLPHCCGLHVRFPPKRKRLSNCLQQMKLTQ